MANLTEASTWDTVYQLESTDQALGGAGGTMNRQAQALLNRTKYLADTKLNTADFKTQLNASGAAPVYACRAWVNFNSYITTLAVLGSANVSSVTDNGVGDYTMNFISAMPHINYAYSGTTLADATGAVSTLNVALAGKHSVGTTTKLTTSCGFICANGSNKYDSYDIAIAIFC